MPGNVVHRNQGMSIRRKRAMLKDSLSVRSGAMGLVSAAAAVVLLLPEGDRRAEAFVDAQLPTLSVIVRGDRGAVSAIAVLKVEKVIREKKAIEYSTVRHLKGSILGRNQEPHGKSFTHILRAANTTPNRPLDIATQDRVNEVVLDLVAEGKQVVVFQRYDMQLVCVGKAWYGLCLNPVGKGSLPQAAASDPRYARIFCGDVEELIAAVTDLLAGKEIVIPRMVGSDRQLNERTGPILRTRADRVDPADRKEIQDWPQWRGPNRDGVVQGVKVPTKWPKALREEWQAPVGEGVSSPVVAGARVYLLTRRKADEELVMCLDLADGKEVWKAAYPAPYKLGAPAHGFEGPRSTPAVADGRVFTFGISGILSCLDVKTGNLLWRKDFAKQYPKTAPDWGTSASPLTVDGLCIVHVGGPDKGGLTAFDAQTGDVKWCYDGDGPAYGSPILADLAGERQIVTLTLNYFVGVSVVTGKLLWKLPCREIHSENCLTPIQFKDLLIFAGRKENPRAIRLEKSDKGITPREVWKADVPTLYMSTPVLVGDFLFGLSDREFGYLFCLDAKSGKTLWRSDGRMECSAAILSAGNVWLVLTTRGQLIVVKSGGTSFERIAEYTVSESGGVWAHPVFLGDRILIRDKTSLRSLRTGSHTK
jgi:outer membrane protein assembly factor BamB